MAVIDLPCSIMRPKDATFHLQWSTRSAGRRLSDGQEQILGTRSAVWQIDYALGLEFDQTRIKQFEAAIASLRGRANIARICVCDPFRYGGRVSPAQQPWSDGTWFSDGTGWMDGSTVHPLTLTANAAGGATQLYVGLREPTRPSLRVGDMFSVNGFLHRVVARTDAGWVKFEPPLREAIPAGAVIETDPPTALVRLASDDQGRRAREMLRWGQPITVSFVEAFER